MYNIPQTREGTPGRTYWTACWQEAPESAGKIDRSYSGQNEKKPELNYDILASEESWMKKKYYPPKKSTFLLH